MENDKTNQKKQAEDIPYFPNTKKQYDSISLEQFLGNSDTKEIIATNVEIKNTSFGEMALFTTDNEEIHTFSQIVIDKVSKAMCSEIGIPTPVKIVFIKRYSSNNRVYYDIL